MNRPDKVILHCAATPDSLESQFTIEDVRNWHIARGFNDVGYHYFIRRDGTVEQGRRETGFGAHTLGHNVNALGICYEGTSFPSIRQMLSLINLYHQFFATYGIEHNRWYGHRDFGNTECPGFDIEDFRRLLSQVNLP